MAARVAIKLGLVVAAILVVLGVLEDVLRWRPGECVPADGVVLDGGGFVDE